MYKQSNLNIQKNNINSLIKYEEEGNIIYQRAQDGYINATAMCKTAGKAWGNYYKSSNTQEFLDALSSDLPNGRTGIILTNKGGIPSMQGTWVHPDVAIHLAQWLSPRFAVKVSKWIREWLSGKTSKSNLSYHLSRYLMNINQIPMGHFSILQEMTITLTAQLEQQGYIIPKNIVPDISEGKIFAKWLKNKGIDTDKMPTYLHRYEDGRVVKAKLYPVEYLPDFRNHLTNVWLPQYAHKYFKKRDESILPYLNQILQLNATC